MDTEATVEIGTPAEAEAPAGSAFELRGIRRVFGTTPVLRSVDLRLGQGEIGILLGANGAGKTTLLKVLATLLTPSAGSGTVLGRDLRREAEAIRGAIGVLFHRLYLYEDLTALENLRFSQTMRGLEVAPERLEGALAAVGLRSAAAARVRTFSNGMRQRLALARLQLQGPRLLLLDEPFAGLDRDGAAVLRGYLEAFRERGGAVLMATHRLDHAAELADRVAILASGRVAFQGQTPGVAGLERLYRETTRALA